MSHVKHKNICSEKKTTQWTIICSKLTLKTLDQGVKYVQS